MKKLLMAGLFVSAVSLVGAAAHSDSEHADAVEGSQLRVVASIRPLHSLVQAVLGQTGEAAVLVNQQSPHQFSLKPSQVRALHNADVVFAIDICGFETFMRRAVEGMPKSARRAMILSAGALALALPQQTDGERFMLANEGDINDLQHHHEQEHGHGYDDDDHDERGKYRHDDDDDDYDDDEYGERGKYRHDDDDDHDDDDEHGMMSYIRDVFDHDEHDKYRDKHEDGKRHGKREHGRGKSYACSRQLLEKKTDPHVWLSVDNAVAMVAYIRDVLARQYPQHAAVYKENAAGYTERLQALKAEMAQLLQPHQNKTFVTQHDAFLYFEKEQGLRGRVLLINPALPLSAKRVGDIQAFIRERDINTIFLEPQFSPAQSKRLLAAVGFEGNVSTIDPLGTTQPLGADMYITMMKAIATQLAENL